MTIFYTNPGYPVMRMILGKCHKVRYVRTHVLSSVLDKMRVRGVGVNALALLRPIQSLGVGCGCHFFNTVAGWPFRIPYITTFETMVPYTYSRDFWFRRALDGICSDACKKLLALSECTRGIQLRFNAAHGVGEVDRKIEVVHPPQELLVKRECVLRKDYDKGALRFIFVGRNFASKGGGEILRTFARLRKDFDIELTIIGDLLSHDNGYMFHPVLDSDDWLFKFVNANSSWIHYLGVLPNADVLEKIKLSHIGLLPTRSDTYGYSVLEMQAAGLPCMTTNVRALPEINSDRDGWIFEVEKNINGNFPEPNPKGIERLSYQIENGLERAVIDACLHRDRIVEKAVHAYDRIASEHDPVHYGVRLAEIYEKSFGS